MPASAAHGYGRRPATKAAIGQSRRAQALAESLGVPEVLSLRAQHRGVCHRQRPRAESWTPHRCARRCRSPSPKACRRRPAAPTRTCNSPSTAVQRRFDEAERYFAEGIAYCDEHEHRHLQATCLRGERAAALERDRAAGRSRRHSAWSCSPGAGVTSPVNRINPLHPASALSAPGARTTGCLGMARRGGGNRRGERRAAAPRSRTTGPRRSALAGGRASRSHTRSRAGR